MVVVEDPKERSERVLAYPFDAMLLDLVMKLQVFAFEL
jgi:hypothetical protein